MDNVKYSSDYWTVKQVAKQLFLTEAQVRRYVRKRKLPFVRLDNRILFEKKEIMEFIPVLWLRLGRGDYIEYLLKYG